MFCKSNKRCSADASAGGNGSVSTSAYPPLFESDAESNEGDGERDDVYRDCRHEKKSRGDTEVSAKVTCDV